MSSLSCPHCNSLYSAGSYYCEGCGKALPSKQSSPVVAYAPRTSAGQNLLSEDLKKTMRKAFTALIIVAVLQTLAGPVLLFAEKARMEREHPEMVYTVTPTGYAIVFGIAGIFYALAIWSRWSPLPAAIAGLVVFCTLHLIEAASDPTSLAKGIILKVIIIAMLASAIKAGIQFRKIQSPTA
ncbi:MAG: zinc ribbon domain-containing protein [Tepidisphaeraceae bacterium]